MPFMVIVKANKDSETGAPLKWELIEAMGGSGSVKKS